MTCGIYQIYSAINNRIYIGSSANIEKRITNHRCQLRNGTHHNDHLQRAWDEYGESEFFFGVICECDRSELLQKEQFYVDIWDSDSSYNLNRQVEELPNMSLDARMKISAAHKGRVSPTKGRVIPESERIKIGNTLRGRKLPEQTRRKMGESRKGHPVSAETRQKISESRKGIKFSDETKRRMSEAKRGYLASKATK